MTKKKRIFNSLTFWVAFAFFVAMAGSFFAWLQISRYEDGVIEIYATQQDAYVQLVLDQINLNREKNDESVIMDIIGTLDSSSNKYWTLANDAAIIFVKDITETNRYKGFTTETYYISDSAKNFIDSLSVNKVVHKLIDIEDKKYIASGVVFSYKGIGYQICLLTNPDAVLDHNIYLEAKINLCVMLSALLCVFLITVIALGRTCTARARQLDKEKANSLALSKMVEKLNEELSLSSLYDARLAVFRMDLLPTFLEKLEAKGRKPVSLLLLEYDSERAASLFLEDGYLMMDKKIIRFHDEKKKKFILVAVGYDKAKADNAVSWLTNKELRLIATECVNDNGKESLKLAAMKLQETGETEDGE